jgi:hypothetical protein
MNRLIASITVIAGLGVLAVSGNALGAELVATAPPSTAPVAEAPTGADEQPGEPMDLGLAPVVLTAPAVSGAGDRPAFAWEAVAGAASYQLAVLTADGEPLWAWAGSETTVILGGWPEAPIPEAPGPLLQGPGTWFVVAFDVAGATVANSVIRPVSPT